MYKLVIQYFEKHAAKQLRRCTDTQVLWAKKMINIYLGTGPVSAYWNWESEYREGWWWEDAFTKRQSSDFRSPGASILCYKVIFHFPRKFSSLTFMHTLTYHRVYIDTVYTALLQCRCIGDEASGDRVGGHIAKKYSLQYVTTPEVSISFL